MPEKKKNQVKLPLKLMLEDEMAIFWGGRGTGGLRFQWIILVL